MPQRLLLPNEPGPGVSPREPLPGSCSGEKAAAPIFHCGSKHDQLMVIDRCALICIKLSPDDSEAEGGWSSGKSLLVRFVQDVGVQPLGGLHSGQIGVEVLPGHYNHCGQHSTPTPSKKLISFIYDSNYNF